MECRPYRAFVGNLLPQNWRIEHSRDRRQIDIGYRAGDVELLCATICTEVTRHVKNRWSWADTTQGDLSIVGPVDRNRSNRGVVTRDRERGGGVDDAIPVKNRDVPDDVL